MNPRLGALDVQMLGTRGLPNRYGGSETCVEEVGVRLRRLGHDVRVFARPRVTGTERREYRGLEIKPLPSVPVQTLDTLSHSFLAILWLVAGRRRGPTTLLHFHGSGNGAVLPLCKALRLRTVVTVDGADWRRDKWSPVNRFLLRLAASMTARLADVVVADSREAIRIYRDLWHVDPLYIPYGAPEPDPPHADDAERLRRLGVPDDYLLFVGRFVAEKRIDDLVRAHRALARPRPALVLVGGKPDDSPYAAEVGGIAADDVVFLGKVFGEDLAPLLRNAAAYVQPSAVEGTSPMVLTAMAYGIPVVASNIPENRETVGGEGFYFSVGEVDSLTSTLGGVIACPQDARLRGERLAERVRAHYDWEAVTSHYVEAYRQALRTS